MTWFRKKTQEKMIWDEPAKRQLAKLPFFARSLVRSKVEEVVNAQGGDTVTLADYLETEARFQAMRGGRDDSELRKMMPAENQPGTPLVILECCRNELTNCPNALIDTKKWRDFLAVWLRERALSERLRQRVAEEKILFHHKLRIAIAGCPNGCSRPQIADVGLVGTVSPVFDLSECTQCEACAQACPDQAISLNDGTPQWDQKPCQGCLACSQACPAGCVTTSPPAMRLSLGGKLGRHPHLADPVLTSHDPQSVLDYLDRIIQQYLDQSPPGERFAAWWVGRQGSG
jgi:dissimilatory sulfite reductase (desulfoviridin) alpha/beta subunit